jgi:hypothetical protein
MTEYRYQVKLAEGYVYKVLRREGKVVVADKPDEQSVLSSAEAGWLLRNCPECEIIQLSIRKDGSVSYKRIH